MTIPWDSHVLERSAVAKTKNGVIGEESALALSLAKKKVKKIDVLNCQVG